MKTDRSTADLNRARRIVVKIGSALLVDSVRGTVHRQWLEALAQDVADARARGQAVVLVTSGAVAVGRRHLKLGDRPLRLDEKQAAAATGQVHLMHAYQETLGHHGLGVAQVLLTLEDSENRKRYLNARQTLETLLGLGVVPVINENDTVAVDEIRFGDNDRLAARVAAMVGADTLLLLSDIDGLYTGDPRKDPDARFLAELDEITPEIEAMAGDPGSAHGSGGMVTKLAAARICLNAGCRMAIALGAGLHPFRRIEGGERCTWFLPRNNPGTARKLWISGSLKATGSLVVDAGALQALKAGKSLLPAGVARVEGQFQQGDSVAVRDAEGREVARGLAAYSADDARRIAGHKSAEIESLLGYAGPDEIIHRDDLVLA
ncbi:MAG: glutamate 5-kinase [Magnetospirillum sp. WYHS-4]